MANTLTSTSAQWTAALALSGAISSIFGSANKNSAPRPGKRGEARREFACTAAGVGRDGTAASARRCGGLADASVDIYRVKRFVLSCECTHELQNLFLFFLKNLFKPCLFMRRRQEKSKEGRGGGRGESCSDCFCGEGARRKHTSRRRGCRRQVGPGARLRPEHCRARILPLLRRRSGWRWVDAELEGPLRGQIGTTYVPTQSRRRTHSHSLPPVGRRRACAPSSAGTNLDRREELLALRRGASPPR